LKAQPHKFLVAKRHDRPEKEPAECKCSERKEDGDISRKCTCIASKELRASQEEFCKGEYQLTHLDCGEGGEHIGRGKDCRSHVCNVNLEIANDDKRHEFECNVDGRYGFAEKSSVVPLPGNQFMDDNDQSLQSKYGSTLTKEYSHCKNYMDLSIRGWQMKLMVCSLIHRPFFLSSFFSLKSSPS